MARHAQRRWRVLEERILLEERSRFTWENVALSLPHLRDAEQIVFASNTFHARRARRYLARQDPELAGRLRRAADWVPGELLPLRPALVLHELVRIRRARRLRVGTRGEESSTR